ncbi:hereditary hemochromatosis protein homolog isoform X2 [Sebastes fasciatus]|uniref:hereditary hemochromatosis protein homolog isoform X1 n=1 Tax=Sebastes fasciatus TaxID=394691 RepID=UPI003D9E2AE4
MQMKWIKLWILCLLLSVNGCGSHSLQWLSTGRVQPGDKPSFEQLTVFDGVPISYCDSSTKREQLKPTLESKSFPEHCSEACYNILGSLHDIPPTMNSTVSVVQRRRGCIQTANGTVSTFEAWAVNGMDFISFDPESQRWTSQSPSAIAVKQRWNKDRGMNFAFRHFIREECPRLIQNIQLRSIHQKTELRVFAKPIVNTAQALLRCHVTSTDKSLSTVHLIGDGASRTSWITVTGPMPSEDGAVILRLTAGISLRQSTNKYGCTVQTGGHNITAFWDGSTLDGRYLPNQSEILTVILGVCCIVFTITLISCVMVFLLKCVKMKSRPTARVDPRLMEQFTRIMESVASPDLQNVIFSFTRGTERNREYQDQWEVMIRIRDLMYYDPDYFAHVNGAHQEGEELSREFEIVETEV